MSGGGFAVRNLSLRLPPFALRDVSLAASPGEIVVLLGPNGAGKSVTLETIAGFHRPDAGRIVIAGRDVAVLPPERRRVAFVVQNFALFPHLTVAENVALGGGGGVADVEALLSRFGIAHLARSRPGPLSHGEKQRAALARALASRPDLYLFDEPFSALDAAMAEGLRDELGDFLRRSGAPALFVTHDRADALALADRVAVIDGGAIHQEGPTEDVFARPASVAVARFLGIENLLQGEVAAVGAVVRVAVGGSIIAAQSGVRLAPGDRVTLSIRAENVVLLPPLEEEPNGDRLAARVVALRRSGPLWKVTLECGFPLVAYALPQTAHACSLAPGAMVHVKIDPAAVHVIAE
jgi:ABC-type Fe3+/spermidine/putrescine transport system ATPase subunit